MKYRPSTRSSRADTAKQPEAAQTPSRTPLTGETITDAAIRELLSEARKEGEVTVAVTCSKALVRVMPSTTPVVVAQRRRARKDCAAEINDRADQWLRYGTRSGYAKYARMLETAQHHESPTSSPDDALPRRKGRKRTLKYTCCWYCNRLFEFGDYVTVQARIGTVIVHEVCVRSLVKHGFLDAPDAKPSDPRPDDE